MRLALQKTYEAMPAPKIVIAVGACAISGGPYIDHRRSPQRRRQRRAGRPLHSRLPAASADHSRRPAATAGPAGRRSRGPASSRARSQVNLVHASGTDGSSERPIWHFENRPNGRISRWFFSAPSFFDREKRSRRAQLIAAMRFNDCRAAAFARCAKIKTSPPADSDRRHALNQKSMRAATRVFGQSGRRRVPLQVADLVACWACEFGEARGRIGGMRWRVLQTCADPQGLVVRRAERTVN